jgi:hypothetical protein
VGVLWGRDDINFVFADPKVNKFIPIEEVNLNLLELELELQITCQVRSSNYIQYNYSNELVECYKQFRILYICNFLFSVS